MGGKIHYRRDGIVGNRVVDGWDLLYRRGGCCVVMIWSERLVKDLIQQQGGMVFSWAANEKQEQYESSIENVCVNYVCRS